MGFALSAFIVGLGLIITKCSGLLRDIIVSMRFSEDLFRDGFTLAFTIPDLFYNLLVGGAIYSTGNLYIDGGVISSNTAKNSGGTIVVADGTAEIYGGTIAYNTAQEYHGGAIYNGADLHIYGGSMTQNYAKLQGGAVLNNGTLTVSGGTITDNCAENNGGVYVPMAARSKCTMTP